MTAAHSAGADRPEEPTEGTAEPVSGALSERDRDILDFEDQWWKFGGAKDQAIRDRFSLSATTYYQVLNGLLDRQEALAHKPMLVKRLRRLRTTRHRARSARRQEA
jgi:hypothetical protein